MGNLIKTVGKVVTSPITVGLIAAKDPTIRTAALVVAGAALGGPAGAAAGYGAAAGQFAGAIAGSQIASSINSAQAGKAAVKQGNRAIAAQEAQSQGLIKMKNKLAADASRDEAKSQSLIARGNRGRSRGGAFGPEAVLGTKGPQATLG